jgi:hypothetical protein
MLASAAAAALAACAVTVAAPALGDGGGAPDKADDFVACLRDHGLGDAPSDPAALKPWLKERLERGDATAKRAVDACSPVGAVAPMQTDVRACLVAHGAHIDGTDPAAVKRWVVAHADDPDARDALKACHISVDDGPPAVACDGKGAPQPGVAKPAPAPDAGTTTQPETANDN